MRTLCTFKVLLCIGLHKHPKADIVTNAKTNRARQDIMQVDFVNVLQPTGYANPKRPTQGQTRQLTTHVSKWAKWEKTPPAFVIRESLNHGCTASYVRPQTWPTSLTVGVSKPPGYAMNP
uniref:Uncharacterized protein n=1 Tax=Rubinisphaera brasiliensis (strain ATCC 49424 / DSM 5305 / JCM 21570 / IAM 15109 / NBRC 103401 / IFAM 1448) TaxID=756272 RepID=F0SGW2_RUBBR|nr:hypothetical protein Plabr_0773 [Rubinisphaera brasiliensis DSM 5305]